MSDKTMEAFEAWAKERGWDLSRRDGRDYYKDERVDGMYIGYAVGAAANAQEVKRLREEAFDAGWRTAANWMNRDDLMADTDSPAYLADRAAALQGDK